MIGFSTSAAVGEWGPADLEMSDYSMDPGGTRGTLVVRGTALDRQRRHAARGTPEAATAPAEMRAARWPRRWWATSTWPTRSPLWAAAWAWVWTCDSMLAGLSDFRGVPGRMEPVDAGQDFTVLVDYAHTPDSVRNVLQTARGFTQGRLIAVVGCGGDRDRGKRPLMGREAEKAADWWS